MELQSSISILVGALAVNQTYQFVVNITNRRNSNVQAIGYLNVKVENTQIPMVVIG